MKLWDKENTNTSARIEAFTVGKDKSFDILLAEYDVLGSLAHTEMLEGIGLLTKQELELIHRELNQILLSIRNATFTIDETAEDIHSQIEWLLTQRIGEAGKKIHSGRSRNDQVAVDIKLFLRAEILKLKDEANDLFDLLIAQSEKFKDKLLPGYTHLQVAMPSSFGLWFGAYAESLVDDLELLSAAYHIANKNPLGSGAGYGSSLPLNRTKTTQLLHFKTLNYNSIYAQMTRGKTEKITAMAISSLAATLSKLSMDCCLFLNQNFSFISFPDELTTGSSIMPHKKNPDVFELIRAKCNRIQSIPNELTLLINNLPSGYHRDLQLTKEILFPALEEIKACFQMTGLMLSQVTVKDHILDDEKYKYIFSVDAVNELVRKGMSFREAYQKIGNDIQKGIFVPPVIESPGKAATHEGSIGNLSNDKIKKEMNKVLNKFS
ncbi:MAG TPA: argininosuccinate lyase [Puia sp.]|nr:argininosuccinate lyase [Puia sp.]